jgi:hypothetical protein
LTVGDIFSDKQVQGIEDYKPINEGSVTWEVDEYHLKRLSELGLDSPDPDDYNIISRS